MAEIQNIDSMPTLLLQIKEELGIEAFSKNKYKELHSIAYMLDYAPQLRADINLLEIAIKADLFFDFSSKNKSVNLERVEYKLREKFFLNQKSIKTLIEWFSLIFNIPTYSKNPNYFSQKKANKESSQKSENTSYTFNTGNVQQKTKEQTKHSSMPTFISRKQYSYGVYSGFILNGNRQGKGRFLLNNGDLYEGDFFEDSYHGQGKYTEKDGFVYEGEFHKGKMQGNGKLITKEGYTYEGEFSNNKFSGNGYINLIFSNGRHYKGNVYNHKPSGLGEMTFPNAGKYTGEFRDGLFHGKGELRFEDGTTFRGDFEHGKITGSGEIINQKGRPIEGKRAIWLADKLRKLYNI